MYVKEDILKNLNADNYFIDRQALDNFIRNWNIDAIYENEQGVEFFDALSISKIKKGISLKSQGYSNEQIIYKINKISINDIPHVDLEKPKEEPQKVEQVPVQTTTSSIVEMGVTSSAPSEMKSMTIDVTAQTLQMIAEAVAEKITTSIKDEISDQLIETGSYKRDNEILAKQVFELLEDNKKMAQRIESLETERKPLWKKFFKF